jgi:V/A-type H+-transporting ATPase subunit E
MALGDLLAALEEEGAAEHERARQERGRQADQILSEAREHAAKASRDSVAAAEARANETAQRLLAAARSDARAAARVARDDALEEVLTGVRQSLSDLPGTAIGAAAASACLEEALAALPLASTVRVHHADAAALRSDVPVKVVADLGAGGAIAEDTKGRYLDNTYLTRLANAWPDLRVALSQSWEQGT